MGAATGLRARLEHARQVGREWLGSMATCLGLRTAIQHAIFSGYVSVVVGVVETTLSFNAGEDDNSDSMLGIAIMAVAEISGSLLVLYRWKFMTAGGTAEEQREVIFAAVIAVMMGLLGSMLFQSSFEELVHPAPESGLATGIFISLFGAASSFALYAYKIHYGEQLRSMVLIADAKCSRCVGLISLAVTLTLALEELVWWADGVMGLALSLYIIHEGYVSLRGAHAAWLAHPGDDEGLRLVPLMHGGPGDEGEEEDLLEETV